MALELDDSWESDWLDETLSGPDLARIHGCSYHSLAQRAKAAGLPPRKRGRKTTFTLLDIPLTGGRWVPVRGIQRWFPDTEVC